MNQTMESTPPPQYPPRPRGRHAWVPLVPVALAAGFLAVLVFRERVLKIPVMIRPMSGAVTDNNIYLYWNPVRGNQVAYHAQIAANGSDFQDVAYEWGEGDDWEKARVRTGQIRVQRRNALSPGRKYFWRVRSVVNGRPRPWSRAVAFRTREEPQRPQAVGLEIGSLDVVPEGLSVRGTCNLPDGMVVAVQLIDIASGQILERAMRFIRNSRYDAIIKVPDSQVEDNQYQVMVNLKSPPFLDYPLSESVGELGERLEEYRLESGYLVKGLAVVAELLREESPLGKSSLSLSRDPFFLEVEAFGASPSEIVLTGKTNLPSGSRLSAAATSNRIQVSLINNEIIVMDGYFRGRLVPREGSFEFAARDHRVVVLLETSFQEREVLEIIGRQGERLGEGDDDDRLIYFNLQTVKDLRWPAED